MPAMRAMSSVEAPCSPLRANSVVAAARTATRRSSAVCRVVVVAIVVSIHSQPVLVKSPLDESGERSRDPVALGLGHRRRERQREGPSEGSVGTGEGAAVAIGGELVDRIGSDLDLDTLGPKRLQRLVTPIELDHVR